ncbi:MAG: sulfite exporter TauE/SafE family protein [Pseudomonadales bacterium]|nr:sulfite exporter TauE/SafE family protein [Pseudomonadales bacterium]
MDLLVAQLSDPTFWTFAAIGFCAQLLDGALGMGFGALSALSMTVIGYPRQIVSASINGAKMFTGAISGISHIAAGNVDWRLFGWLLAGGLSGALAGALLLTRFTAEWVGLAVDAYLFTVGVYILYRARRRPDGGRVSAPRIASVGGAAGFLEAMIGVWGPLATGNLIALGTEPRHAVGTGNLAEAVIAVVVFTVLVQHVGFERLSVAVLGLLIGALLSAPLAAFLTARLPKRRLMLGVGALVIAISLLRLWRDFWST